MIYRRLVAGAQGGAGESDLARVEAAICARIPDGLRTFLSEVNGGRAALPSFKRNDLVLYVQDFLRVEAGSVHDILSVRERVSDAVDVGKYLPFARTDGGDLICVKLENGGVYWWRHDQKHSQNKFDKLECIAPNFVSFVGSMRRFDAEARLSWMRSLAKDGVNGDLAKALARGALLETEDGMSLVEMAAMYDNVGLTLECLTHGIPVGNAMHIAALNGSFGVVDLLVQRGVDINGVDGEGKSPLDCAAWNQDYVIELRKRGAKCAGPKRVYDPG